MYTIHSSCRIKIPTASAQHWSARQLSCFISFSGYLCVWFLLLLPLLLAHHLTQSHQTLPKCRTPRFASSSVEKYGSFVWLLSHRISVTDQVCFWLLFANANWPGFMSLRFISLPFLILPIGKIKILTLHISLPVMPLIQFSLNMNHPYNVLFMSLWLLWPGNSQKEQAVVACTLKRASTWHEVFVFKLYQVEYLD